MSSPILIQGAMAEETDYLVSQLEAVRKETIGGYRFWRGSRRGRELIVSRTEMGELNAACVTTLGILTFQPGVVINQGIAGAHSRELHIGDIVVGEHCVYLDGWEAPLRAEGEGSDPLTWSQMEECRLLLEGDRAWLERVLDTPYAGGRLVKGCLGSGDFFSREYDRIVWMARRYGHLCEDMESSAVYKTCHRLGVPCLGVRMISNNELTGEPYTPTVGERLQEFLLEALGE